MGKGAKKTGRDAKKLYPVLAVVIALSIVLALYYNHHSSIQGQAGAQQLRLRFDYLSQQHTNLCALQDYIYSLPDNGFLQGSCCTFMNFSSYVQQVGGLSNYSNVEQIPKDPYNVSVSLAKELLGYDRNISLNPAQQIIYNEAVNMSSEHGPCCCRCWRWYAFEGQAKYFLVHSLFGARQIANVWDLEDGCGGPFDSQGFQPIG